MLSTENIPLATGISQKFSPKYIGHFTITEKLPSGLSYRLDLRRQYKIHPIFHISLLKPHKKDLLNRYTPRKVISDTSKTQRRLERIMKSRTREGQVQFLVHYKNTDASEDKWISQQELNAMKNKSNLYEAYQNKQFAGAFEDE